jgi:serine/threonine-protein kinase HipA
MPDVEVHIDLDGGTTPTNRASPSARRPSAETVMFEYDEAWLTDCNRFSIEPALTLTRGAFPMPRNQKIFGSIGDSAPDTWGRRLMQRSERRQTEKEQRPVKTLTEADDLLGVADANASRRTSLPLDWQSDAPGATPSPVSLPLLNWGGYGERNCVGKDPSLGIRRKNPTARQAIWVYDETQRLIARAGTMGFKVCRRRSQSHGTP